MTAVGVGLCRSIENLDQAGPKEVEAVTLRVDSPNLVIGLGMKGDGAKQAIKVLSGRQRVCDTLLA